MEDITGALTVKDVVTRVRQRPVLAVAPMMLGLLLSVAYVVLTPPTYSATASVKVEPVVADRYAGNINVSNIISMQTEMQVVQSTSVAALAADTLGIDMRTVRHSIAVSSPQDTQVVDITYSAGSPAAAVRGAATVADSYLTYSKQSKQAVAKTQYAEVLKNIDEVQKQIAVKSTTALQTQLDVLVQSRRSLESLLANTAGEIINKPVEPTSPASPKPLVAIPAGLGLGAILGLALAVLWPARSRRRLTAPVPPRASGAVAPQHGRPAAGG
ncbi:Wzz/FepE/Etk N-terminal domain-containing protein, partial [Kineosporia sp. R_H_3]|uniref:Wzz/FepE/Etk N-terminal domain-containing protein n=1 Tax=Kineosporia sp. R_H_3 TaxID=1961848 RepID=UPI001E3B601C